jgi:hypothetical protein
MLQCPWSRRDRYWKNIFNCSGDYSCLYALSFKHSYRFLLVFIFLAMFSTGSFNGYLVWLFFLFVAWSLTTVGSIFSIFQTFTDRDHVCLDVHVHDSSSIVMPPNTPIASARLAFCNYCSFVPSWLGCHCCGDPRHFATTSCSDRSKSYLKRTIFTVVLFMSIIRIIALVLIVADTFKGQLDAYSCVEFAFLTFPFENKDFSKTALIYWDPIYVLVLASYYPLFLLAGVLFMCYIL